MINGGSFSDVLKSAAIGAVTGVVGAVTGGFLHGFGEAIGGALAKAGMTKAAAAVAGKVIHAAAHGVAGGAMSAAMGGSFKDGFIGSAIGAGVSAVTGSIPGLDFLEGDGALKIVARTAVASISGGVASALAGGKFADGAFSAAFFHLFNHELKIAFKGKTYTAYGTSPETLEASLEGSYQMEKGGRYLGHCHAEAQFFTGAPDSKYTAGGPTLAELIDAGVELNGVAFSTFGGPDGSRINNSKHGYDHTVIVVTRHESVTKPQTFFQKLFRAKPVTTNSLKVYFYENYRDKLGIPVGLQKRLVHDFRNERGGSNHVSYQLIIKK